MNNLEHLTRITENLITEINYIMRHTNRNKLTRTSVKRLQIIRGLLEKDLIYYKFMSRAGSNIDMRMVEDKSNHINILSSEVNIFKRLLQ